MKKKVLITFNGVPFGSLFHAEGLEQHSIRIAYLGEGVYYAIKGADKKNVLRYIKELKKIGCTLMVEREALNELDISEKEIDPEFEIVLRSRIVSTLTECDLTIDF
jgi:intracellular sulfur oxidation DsrE/DsrF family protein